MPVSVTSGTHCIFLLGVRVVTPRHTTKLTHNRVVCPFCLVITLTVTLHFCRPASVLATRRLVLNDVTTTGKINTEVVTFL